MKNSVRIFWLASIALVIAVTYVAAYLMPHQEDLVIYLNGSQALLELKNPYASTGNQYIYGPLLGILLIPLTKLDINLAKVIWGMFSLATLAPILFLLLRLRTKTSNAGVGLGILILILSSFSFRNNLSQGQAVSFLLALTLLALYLSNSDNRVSQVVAAISILPVIEIKPYLAIGVVVYLLLLNKKKILLDLAAIILILNLLYYYIFKISYLDWLYALEIRSKSVMSGNDQSSFVSILSVNFNFDSRIRFYLITFYYLVVAYIVYRYRGNIKRSLLPFCLVFPSVITPFLHAHDVLFTFAGLLLVADFQGKFHGLARQHSF